MKSMECLPRIVEAIERLSGDGLDADDWKMLDDKLTETLLLVGGILISRRKIKKISRQRNRRKNARLTNKDVKLKANALLRQAVRRGEISKPDRCEKCGRRPHGEIELQGHHPDYSKPLEVRWLCNSCHGMMHEVENTVVALPPVRLA